MLTHYLRKHFLPARVLLPFYATVPLPVGETEPCIYIRVSPLHSEASSVSSGLKGERPVALKALRIVVSLKEACQAR